MLAVDDWVLIMSSEDGHVLARITSVDFWPTVNLREYETELVSEHTTLWVMGGLCGIVGTALTFVPAIHITEVDAHHVRTIPVAALLQKLYAAFDESDGDEDDSEEDDDSEDHGPRRSKRARHDVEKLGAWVK